MLKQGTWVASVALGFASCVWGQSTTDQNAPQDRQEQKGDKPGAAREIGAGTATAGSGAAKGAGHAAEGGAKAAGDLVTLHPIHAGASAGEGAAKAGKDVTVGTAKGTGKAVRGVGRAFKKLF